MKEFLWEYLFEKRKTLPNELFVFNVFPEQRQKMQRFLYLQNVGESNNFLKRLVDKLEGNSNLFGGTISQPYLIYAKAYVQ